MKSDHKNDKGKHAQSKEHDHSDDEHAHAPHQEHAEEGEPWLVSYADMMTLLFGFFVVMYSFAMRDPKSQECIKIKLMQAFKDEAAQMDNLDPSGSTMQGAAVKALQMLVTLLNLDSVDDLVEKIQADADKKARGESSASDAKKDMKEKSGLESLKALLGADDVKNTTTISIPSDILFRSGSTELEKVSEYRIKQIVDLIRTYNDLVEVSIIGHTDSASVGGGVQNGNWNLSVQRSAVVAQLFEKSGIKGSLLNVVGKGSASPLVPEKSANGKWIAENMQKNRRIDIVIQREKK